MEGESANGESGPKGKEDLRVMRTSIHRTSQGSIRLKSRRLPSKDVEIGHCQNEGGTEKSENSNTSDLHALNSLEACSKGSGRKEGILRQIESKESLKNRSREGEKHKYARLPSMQGGKTYLQGNGDAQEQDPNLEPEKRLPRNTHLSNPGSNRRSIDCPEDKNQFALFDFSAKPLNSQAALQKQNRLKPKMFIQKLQNSSRKRVQSGENIDVEIAQPIPQKVIRQRLSENAPTQSTGGTVRPSIDRPSFDRASDPILREMDPSRPTNTSTIKKMISEQTITLLLKSSWGSSKISGLSQVQFFDREGHEIDVNPEWVCCKNCGLAAPQNLFRLLQKKERTCSDNWGFVINYVAGEIIFDLRSTKPVSAIRVYNLRPERTSVQYGGIKDFSVFVNGKEIHTGQLPKPFEGSDSLGLMEEIQLKGENLGLPQEHPSYLNRMKVQQHATAQKVFSKTHQFGSLQPEHGLGLPEKKNVNPLNSTTAKQVRTTADNFNIISDYNLSDDDSNKQDGRGSSFSKPEAEDGSCREQGTNYVSVGSSERVCPLQNPRGRTQTHPERSLSKASRESQDSKVRKHPRIANSSAKYIFTTELSQQTRPTAATSAMPRAKMQPITPGRVFTLQDQSGSNNKVWTKERDSSHDPKKSTDISKKAHGTRSSKDLLSGSDSFWHKSQFDRLVESNQDFEIPNLPLGKVITLTLFTNWGDAEHIGFHGIEFFDVAGNQIDFPHPELSIQKAEGGFKDIHNDPEFLKKLISGPRVLGDPESSWMMKVHKRETVQLKIRLPCQTRLSLIRIFNYCGSRLHSSRGIRLVSIHFDVKLVFLGEIARCSGGPQSFIEEAEYITFTSNKTILSNIDNQDWISKEEVLSKTLEKGKSLENNSPGGLSEDVSPKMLKILPTNLLDFTQLSSKANSPRSRTDMARRTATQNFPAFMDFTGVAQQTIEKPQSNFFKLLPAECGLQDSDGSLMVDSIEIKVMKTWGNCQTFGIRAIEFYDSTGNKIKIGREAVECEYDSLQGKCYLLFSGDPLKKSEDFFWIAKFSSSAYIKINLSKKTDVSKMIVFNYPEKRGEDRRGVHLLRLTLNKSSNIGSQ